MTNIRVMDRMVGKMEFLWIVVGGIWVVSIMVSLDKVAKALNGIATAIAKK